MQYSRAFCGKFSTRHRHARPAVQYAVDAHATALRHAVAGAHPSSRADRGAKYAARRHSRDGLGTCSCGLFRTGTRAPDLSRVLVWWGPSIYCRPIRQAGQRHNMPCVVRPTAAALHCLIAVRSLCGVSRWAALSTFRGDLGSATVANWLSVDFNVSYPQGPKSEHLVKQIERSNQTEPD